MFRFIIRSLLFIAVSLQAESLPPLSQVDQAVHVALERAPQLSAMAAKQAAFQAQREAADRLPNPEVSLQLLNLPVNSFDLAQEPMTQVQLAIVQPLNRGDSVAISQSLWQQKALQTELGLADYRAKLSRTVHLLWIELYRMRQHLLIIDETRELLTQGESVVNARYSSALAGARQGDILKAQLELSRLHERRLLTEQRMATLQVELRRWLGDDVIIADTMVLPNLALTPMNDGALGTLSNSAIIAQLMQHPYMQILARETEIKKLQKALTEQDDKPQWKFSASYGHRQDDLMGDSRDDFFSIGVRFDLPLFNEGQNHRAQQAAQYQVKMSQYNLKDELNRWTQEVKSLEQTISSLTERQTLFTTKLLEQALQNADAALTAYTNDDGDFSAVIQANIDRFSIKQQKIDVDIELAKAKVSWNYYMTVKHVGPALSAPREDQVHD